MKKRLVSILLATAMLLTLLPATALADGETNITSTGLDFSTGTPTEITRYTTNGNGTVTWDPTASPAMLTFENATIQATAKAGDADHAYAVRLPNAPVRVIFNGTNSIAALNDKNAYAFDCQAATEFVLSSGSTATLTAAKRLGSDDNQTNGAAVGISAVGHNVTITGGGALNVVARGNDEHALNAGAAAVILNGCAFSATHGSKVTASTVTLNGVTVPAGRILNLKEISTVVYQANSAIEGELQLKDNTLIGDISSHVDGGGSILINRDARYFTDGVRSGGEMGNSGLNLSYYTPNVKTAYTTGGKRTIEWEPTLGDGSAVTGGKLTLTDANINVAVGTVYATAAIVTLPAVPVTVVLNGTNNFTIKNTPDATIAPGQQAPPDNVDYHQFSAFLCLDKAIFMIDGETNINVTNTKNMPSYALNNKAHEITVLGPGKLNISTSADAGADKADIRSGKPVTLGGGLSMSGVVKPSSSGRGHVYLGNITIPEGETLDLSAVYNVEKDGENGAVNDGLLVLPLDTSIDMLGLTGTGIVKYNSHYYTNSGIKVRSQTTCIDFNDAEQTWRKAATLEGDGYTYSKDATTGVYTITFGDLVIDADSTGPAVTLPNDGNVNVVLAGKTYFMNSGGGVCMSAAKPLTIRDGGGKLYMGASGASNRALFAPSLAFIKTAVTTPAGAVFSEENDTIMLEGSPAKIVTIGSAVTSATVGAVSVSGIKNVAIAATDLSITLASEQFKGVSAGQDVTAWFTNIPEGLAATVKSNTGSTAVITISGTSTVLRSAAMAIAIPDACLASGEPLTVTANENAKWAIGYADVTAVTVGGTAGTISGMTISVVLPYGTAIPADASAVSITAAAGAAVSGLATANNGATWTFIVTTENGATQNTYTINVSVAADTEPSSSGGTIESGAVYNAGRAIWLTGGGLSANDLLVTERNPSGSAYDALRALAKGADVFNTYNIYMRGGKKATGSALYLSFDLSAKYAGQAFTLVHQKADGAYEYFYSTADASGDLQFGPLYELSPFMLVNGTLAQTMDTGAVDIPKTGERPLLVLWAGLALMACAALAAGAMLRQGKRS